MYKILDRSMGHYDLIFADPPYAIDSGALEKLLPQFFKTNGLLRRGCLLLNIQSKRPGILASFFGIQKVWKLCFFFFQ